MFAKITNGVVEKYPYTIGMLRKEYPNTSFPKVVEDDSLEAFGVYRVEKREKPEYDHTQNLQCKVIFQSGKWVESYKLTNASAAELAERTSQKAEQVRYQRNELLADCDWTQVADAPVDKEAWANYRQALRDITNQDGFPFSVVWPLEP